MGVQDYETFSEQLDSLGRWMVEAEEALKVQDPNGSSDLSIIQDRMEELKVSHCDLQYLATILYMTDFSIHFLVSFSHLH